jgi:HTH-like domain
MINRKDPLPVTKQCHILELSRSSVYYMPTQVSDKDAELMRLIDEIHLEEPYLGSRGMKSALRMRGCKVGRIHVRTLMRQMGIEAIYKKPHLSKPHPGHAVYPYLLRGLDITKANAVWCSDITYIPMARGFCYLVYCLINDRSYSFSLSDHDKSYSRAGSFPGSVCNGQVSPQSIQPLLSIREAWGFHSKPQDILQLRQ